MAAGLTIKKNKISLLEDFIHNDYSKKIPSKNNLLEYDAEISPSAININFTNDFYRLYPFGNDNPLPLFLLRRFKIIKTTILDNKHISTILKPHKGSTIKSICFNCMNTDLGNYLLSYKDEIDVTANISLNLWNNRQTTQLIIKDIFI